MAKKKELPFVIAYGEEGYLLDRTLAKGRAQKGRSVTVLDGTKMSGGEVVSACESATFDASDRVVVLDNAQKVSDVEALEEYIDEKDPGDTSVILVAAVRSKELKGVWAKAAKKGVSTHCEAYKPWQGDKIVARIQKEAKALGVTLGEGVAEGLYKVLGDNLGHTVNEMRKLSHLVGKGEPIEKSHIIAVVSSTSTATAFQVSEAAFGKQPQRALKAADYLYRDAGESASVQIVSALMYQLERVLVARQMLDRGDDPKTIALRFGMHEFACKKNLLPLARAHKFGHLLDQMQNLCRLETQVKGAATSKRTRVELALLSIST